MSELRRFNLVANGYDCYQVNNEIDRLEYRISELNDKVLMYQNQIETVNNQFSQIKKRYQLLVSELSMREKQADDVARLALKEANSMIEEAQSNADGIIEEATNEVQSYLDAIREFDNNRADATNQVREAMARLMETFDRFNAIAVPDLFTKDEQ